MLTTRIVTKSGKNQDGDITSLCNDGEWWSPRSRSDAISDIKGGTIEYRVKKSTGPVVIIVDGPTGEYLRSAPDSTTSDNLDDLPNC